MCDLDSDCQQGGDLKEELCLWAINCNATHTQVNSLLEILVKHHANLPRDARTLLKTCRTVTVKELAGGHFYHFGLEKMMKESLQAHSIQLNNGNTLYLQVGIDGLPLFKSSNIQFWPILGKLTLGQKSLKPFIISLYCGPSKPNDASAFLSDLI